MKKRPGLTALLKPYQRLIGLLVFCALVSNTASLFLPRLTGLGINGNPVWPSFALASLMMVVFTIAQNGLQVYASERVARDLRRRLAGKIAEQDYLFVQRTEPSRLLTNLTADVDSVKTYVAEVIAGLFSALFVLAGATAMLIYLNWRLGLAMLSVIPLIGLAFGLVLKRLRPLFRQVREVTDALNKAINENVAGAALIRVVNAGQEECRRFEQRNGLARDLGFRILRHFAALIPVINMLAQLATLIILALGGRFIIAGSMSVGDLATFNGYLALVIFPIFVIGFMNTLIAQASAAYERLAVVLEAVPPPARGGLTVRLRGQVEVHDLCLSYAERAALDRVSFRLEAGSRTAVIGPTAAGKTQLLYLLAGLLPADSGTILYDGEPLENYERTGFHRQVAMVFQESILFRLSIRENVAFSQEISETAWRRAIETAELHDFLERLPEGAETLVSEFGSSLSGGQKQRLMLARALALEPTVLLLDDFTSRVDPNTERQILANLKRNYPELTLLTVTQRVATVEDYDQVLLLMEGQLLARGTHRDLLESCPEYMQICESQKSIQEYELPTD